MTDESGHWPSGVGRAWLDEIDSTNEEAKRRAAAGERGPLWIAATRQSAGRGRRGRSWESPAGNLFATLLLDPGAPQSRFAELSFLAALAVADTVAACAPDGAVALKWPNDVLLAGRKVSGILLEGAEGPGGPLLVAGIGINLAHPPAEARYPATALAEHLKGAAPPAPEAALALLAAAFAGRLEVWRREGFAPVRASWLGLAAGLGQPIEARLQTRSLAGVFAGIDETGALLLSQPGGSAERIAAGEIYFPAPAKGP